MLHSLTAHGFRNLDPLVWRPGPGSHLLLGDNGAGKTSLLEAIYVLATTKSFRTAQLADCARQGSARFHLEGEVDAGARIHLAVHWRRDGEKGRQVNGRTAPLGEHLAALPVVAWTAADGELLTGPPELRRRFLDRGVVGVWPGALAILARYRRALRAKRELLASARPAGRWQEELAPWNEVLAEAGAEVIRRRRDYVERLAGELKAVLALAALPFPPIAVAYRPSPASAAAGAEAAGLGDLLRRAAPRERERGQPLVGPHRDDLELLWGDRPLRGTVSAGERRALGLLLHAAHGRVLAAAGHAPVYLLDDADAELAAPTLAALWPVFSAASQLFASSNRPRVWKGLAVAAVHPLAGGRLGSRDGPQTST